MLFRILSIFFLLEVITSVGMGLKSLFWPQSFQGFSQESDNIIFAIICFGISILFYFLHRLFKKLADERDFKWDWDWDDWAPWVFLFLTITFLGMTIMGINEKSYGPAITAGGLAFTFFVKMIQKIIENIRN